MQTVQDILKVLAAFLEEKRVYPSRRNAEEVLSTALNLSRLDLYLSFDKPLSYQELERSREVLRRFLLNEPLAYIKGSVEFFGATLKVDSRALIPRVETELLVDYVYKTISSGKVLDLCTGSGCIAIALKKKAPCLSLFAIDISLDALSLAVENAQANDVDVKFVHSDLFSHWVEEVDCIVSNPPYISHEEYDHLDPSVKSFEPSLALKGGVDGLDFYRILADEAKKYLSKSGQLWLEIGYNQGSRVEALFKNADWSSVSIIQDYAGLDRFCHAKL